MARLRTGLAREVVKALVRCRGSTSTRRDNNGPTPLLIAANGHESVVKALVRVRGSACQQEGGNGSERPFHGGTRRADAIVHGLINAGLMSTDATRKASHRPSRLAAAGHADTAAVLDRAAGSAGSSSAAWRG